MLPQLSADEARIIGALIEKSIVTPDQYPLTLNALTNACNQKTGRSPVTSLAKGEVQRLTRLLSSKRLVRIEENFRSSVEKYTQTFCNTRYNEFKFDEAELALICVLLLRGAQTPGELRTNCRRLHEFADNEAVTESLMRLAEHPQGAMVARLPRAPGRRDSEYMHQFCGEIETVAQGTDTPSTVVELPQKRDRTAELEARVERLEAQVGELRKHIPQSD